MPRLIREYGEPRLTVAAPTIPAVLPPDVASRRETKYVLPDRDLDALRALLQRTCRPIVHAHPRTTVRSIYFDDASLGACHANLDGLGLRRKYRVRWYDTESPETAYFEVKWRRHRIVGKQRVRMDLRDTGDSLGELRRAINQALPDHHRTAFATAPDAITTVTYEREHFIGPDDTRLTIDANLRFVPLRGRRRQTSRFAIRLPGVVILECKQAASAPESLRLLAPLRARPTRFSKYVTACQELGYVAATL